MAVNDRNLTESVRKARTYFRELETELLKKKTEEIEVKDGEMVSAAGYAASALADGFGKTVGKRLQEKDLKFESLIEGYTPTRVGAMCQEYHKGQRMFGLTWISEARIACEALVNHTEILEMEQSKSGKASEF